MTNNKTVNVPVDAFVARNDSDDYPFNGEEYDLKLVTFAFNFLKGLGYLTQPAENVTKPETSNEDVSEALEKAIDDTKDGTIMPVSELNKLIGYRLKPHLKTIRAALHNNPATSDPQSWIPLQAAPKPVEGELLPCPFCGGEVTLEQPEEYKNSKCKEWWGVVCRNTANLGGSCAIEQRASRTKEAAIKRWNTRAALSNGVGERDKQLTYEIMGGEVRISIGVDLLVHAVTHQDRWPEWVITDNDKFAAAILQAMQEEDEQGNQAIHNAFDIAAEKAIEYGTDIDPEEFSQPPQRTEEKRITMNNKEKLKSCPFCGGKAATVKNRSHAMADPADWWGAICDEGCENVFLDCRASSEEEAITIWNTRAPAKTASGLTKADLSGPYEDTDLNGKWCVDEQLYPESRGHIVHRFESEEEAEMFITKTPD